MTLRAWEAIRGGINSFGGANAGTAKEDVVDTANTSEEVEYSSKPEGKTATTLGELKAFMDNLACAARADATTLAGLVKSNTALITANAKLAAKVEQLDRANQCLQNESNKCRGRKS